MTERQQIIYESMMEEAYAAYIADFITYEEYLDLIGGFCKLEAGK